MTERKDLEALAYRNKQFLDTPEARSLRILSEYLYPLKHFKDQKIQDTIVFFGSARTLEMGATGRYYREVVLACEHRLHRIVWRCRGDH